jgi:hypothetical protein
MNIYAGPDPRFQRMNALATLPTFNDAVARANRAFELPQMQEDAQYLKLQQSMSGGNAGGGSPRPQKMDPMAGKFLMNTPPAFGGFRAMGGPVMPGKGYMVGEPALNDPTAGPAGMVWNTALKRWVPKKKDAVGGETTWDVKNFGKYNGLTSAGPIGMASQPGPARTGLADFYENNPDQPPMTPGMTPSAMAPVKDWMSTIVPGFGLVARRATGTEPGKVETPNVPLIVGDKAPDEWADARRASEEYYNSPYYNSYANPAALPEIMVSPSGAQVVGKNGPEVIVPKEPSYIIPNPANVAAARTMGVPSSIQMGQMAEAPAPPPPLRLAPMPLPPAPMTPSAMAPVKDWMSTIVPGSGPARRAMGQMAEAPAPPPPLRLAAMPLPMPVQMPGQPAEPESSMPPAPMGYQPIGANYKPSQSNLVWTGTGWGRAQPGGIRQSDLRRFMRSPEGVRFQLNQQAETTRTERQDQRSDARDKAVTDAQQQVQQQAKLDKEAEDAAADARFNNMLDALASAKSILSPNQRATLAKIKGVKERQSALEVFMKANETEAEQAAKAKADEITTMPIAGTNTMAIIRNGQLFNTVSGSKAEGAPQARFMDLGDGTGYYADPQGNPIPQEKILRRQDLPGRGVLKNDPGATLVPAFPEQMQGKPITTAPITTTRRLPGARLGDPETTETLQWKADENNPNGGEWIPLPVAGAAAAVPTWKAWAKSKKGS